MERRLTGVRGRGGEKIRPAVKSPHIGIPDQICRINLIKIRVSGY